MLSQSDRRAVTQATVQRLDRIVAKRPPDPATRIASLKRMIQDAKRVGDMDDVSDLEEELTLWQARIGAK